jgi:hypothetical protein
MMHLATQYDAEAKAAIRTAATATSDADRLKWIRIALAWHELARDQQNDGAEGHSRHDAGCSTTRAPER